MANTMTYKVIYNNIPVKSEPSLLSESLGTLN